MAVDPTAPDPTASAPAAPYDPDQLAALVAQLRGQTQTPTAPPAPVNRSIVSLLGEALGGGTTGMSPADREAAGTRALMNFGTNMMAASGPSVMPRSFGQIFGQGVGGAEQSLAGSEEVSAARLAAQQAYQEKQQELNMEALKTAIPILQYQYQAQLAAKAGQIAGQTPPTSIGTAAPGSIGAPILARDPNAGTAGQQGNNPGNVSVTPGSPLPAGTSAAIPVAGGKYVAAFPDVPTGVAAHSDTLNSYAASGTNTIRAAVTKWVGDPNVPKATMDSYVADVAKAAGVDPDATIDLTDPKVQRAFILAQQPHESGKTWLSPGDVDKGLALAAARRAQVAQTPAQGTTAPTPYKVVSAGATIPAPPAVPAASTPPASPIVVQQDTMQPGETPAQVAQRRAAAAAVPTTPPTPTVPDTSVVPPAPQPTAPPENPDITVGGVTTKYPGDRGDYIAQHRLLTPTIGEYDPKLDPGTQASFDTRAKGIALQKALLPTIGDPVAQQKATADLAAQSTALDAEQSAAAAAKRATANAAINKFNEGQNTDVGKLYDAQVQHYQDIAKSVVTSSQDMTKADAEGLRAFNTKMIEPYVTAATQSQGILPNIALAKQVIQMLPDRPVPQLSEDVKNKLTLLEPYLPAGWQQSLHASELTNQVLGGLVAKMGANVQSGQPGGRASAYDQFQTMLPKLQQTQEGREMALTFMEELAKRQIAESTFMQNYQWDPKNMDPVRKAANMSGALAAMNAPGALPPMLKLPPMNYNPNISNADPNAAANRARYNDYFDSIDNGGRYIGYRPDENGHLHPVAMTKVAGKSYAQGVE